ncbi:MAG: transposase [Clostridium argentinense]|uniref:transposase n=1 Tax=Clostridium butanoliproducens TaxID=2991837 RepID=UPI001D8ECB5B|nr:transposase [Clostridium butanoliproducens]MBS5825336.1 transposase [Clostridium argentinense]
MARKARELCDTGIYHIMTRSFPNKLLFYDDEDKRVMLRILRKLQVEENFRVYAYCLMDNHTHFIIDINGGDLGKVMKKFNLRYGGYLRKTNKHEGPVFRDRYKSKPIENDAYLIEVSKYIHRNAVDIIGYRDNPEVYEFSSLSLYLGLKKDNFKICDEDFIMRLFGKTKAKARENYYKTMFKTTDDRIKEIEFETEKSEYRSEKVILFRNLTDKQIREFICKKTKIEEIELNLKYRRESRKAKALYVVFLIQFAGKKAKEICGLIGNITQSNISKLCSDGVELILESKFYKSLLDEFIEMNSKVVA